MLFVTNSILSQTYNYILNGLFDALERILMIKHTKVAGV